jgi:pseudaminic acid synthase
MTNILKSNKTFIIAELSANHNQSLEVALKTIRAAADAGADAIKLQTYTADTLTIDCQNKYFKIHHGTLWDGRTLYDLYKEAHTPWDWHEALFAEAKKCGLVCFSTPFDYSAVDFLEKLNVPAYKVASFEIFDTPLIEYMARHNKPVIMSTGLATLPDIEDAVAACYKAGNKKIALLKCTSAYPAPVEEANLLTLPDMKKRFKCTVGLSDHTLGTTVALTSVALGAKIIEKHFILDKKLGGPDAAFSLSPGEFGLMVRQVREAEKAMGKVTYEVSDKARPSLQLARSLFVVKDIKKGEELTPENIRSIRPGYGISPKHYHDVMGKKTKTELKRGTPLAWDDIVM